MNITIAYFSATNTTKSIVKDIASEMGGASQEYNLTNQQLKSDVFLSTDELLVVGMPVYAGRIPSLVVDSLRHFKGSHTPVILVAVYGNREFDDALVEMQDIAEANGFFVMAGGAFVAQHSIFPHTAKGRPNSSDRIKIKAFAQKCNEILAHGVSTEAKSVSLPGNRPYKVPGEIPLKVVTTSKCTECMLCTRICPVEAIPKDNPHVTNYDKCIHCGRCIVNCREHARKYGGLLYHVAGMAFGWKNRKPKDPQFFFN